jgi:predicted CoA-binding protein
VDVLSQPVDVFRQTVDVSSHTADVLTQTVSVSNRVFWLQPACASCLKLGLLDEYRRVMHQTLTNTSNIGHEQHRTVFPE